MKAMKWTATLLTLAACVGTSRAADEAEAVAALKKVGGTILHAENDPKKPVTTVYLPGDKVKDADLKQVATLTQLKVLKLDAAKNITDAGLKEIAGLKQLTDLGLGSTQVTDAGLKHLSEMKDLRLLNLNFTKVTDAGVKDIVMFTKLEGLGIFGTAITPEGLKKIQEALPKCKITK